MPQQRIRREYLEATFNHRSVPVVRIWYCDEMEITVAFAAKYQLPLLPVLTKDYHTLWCALATSGRETIRLWANEFVTGCELHNVDMSYPRIARKI